MNFAIRMLQVMIAVGIAIFAVRIEPTWLGFLVLLIGLSAFAWLSIRWQRRTRN